MLPITTPAATLPLTPNPCTLAPHDPAVDLTSIDIPAVFARPPGSRPPRRECLDLRACKSAAEAMAGFDRAAERYIFFKGRFALLDLLQECLAITGPAALYLSTWSAEPRDVARALEFLDAGKITGARWLIDPSLQRRAPGLTQKLRDLFGLESIRMGANHAKFAVIINDHWRIVLRTSQNIEQLRSNEQYTIAHDPHLAAWLADFLDALWRPRPALARTTTDPLDVGDAASVRITDAAPAPTLPAASTRETRRRAAAAAAIATLSPTTDLYGFTCGRFSFIDLIDAALTRVEPAALTLASWTVQTNDLAAVARWHRHGRITSARFLIDKSIASRPGATGVLPFIREHFGPAAVALDNNHGKWAVLSPVEDAASVRTRAGPIVIHTSANLNYNPRFEDFSIAHDAELAAFLQTIITTL